MMNQTASFRVSDVIAHLDRKSAGHVQTFEQRQESERAAREQLKKDLTATALAVATELGAGWKLDALRDPSDDNGYRNLSHTDGRSFSMFVSIWGKHDGKVSVSGNWNFGDRELGISFPYGKSQPKISVALDRGAAVIAREITRRFLPEYDKFFAEISEMVRVHTEHRDRKTGIVGRLAAVAGAEPGRIHGHKFSVYHDSDAPHVAVEVYGTVTLKFDNLNEELAAYLLQVYNDRTNGGRNNV
jgi:hypothetical protein